MHQPVLLKEALDILDLHEGDVYLDATLGQGGHAAEAFKRFGEKIKILGIDADPKAVEMSRERIPAGEFQVLNFREIRNLEVQLPNKILFDLGWNKSQFEEGGRGFSFQKDEPLQMNYGKSKFTAGDLVNTWEAENIETILESYGEEKFAKKIAEKIVEARAEGPIKTTFQLVGAIKLAVPNWYKHRKIHPATKTFQALRIAVNDELQALSEGLAGAFDILPRGGRMAVISFHSLEDRIVKRFFKDKQLLTKKPIVPTREEILKNPRSRSAKLRAIQK